MDVYAEAPTAALQVFVRDRGPGFDPAALPADRRGVRESIVGRMERHGGRAHDHEQPGDGTEVELVLEAGDERRRACVIVDDHQLFRSGVRAELERCSEIAGEAGTVDEADGRDRRATSPTWCCWTCTCPTAAASR